MFKEQHRDETPGKKRDNSLKHFVVHFRIDILVPQNMKPKKVGDPLTFPLAPQ